MPALAQIDLGTLTPEQRAAAVQAIAALETLRTENETLTADKACLAAEKDVLADRNEAQYSASAVLNIWCASCSVSSTARGRRS